MTHKHHTEDIYAICIYKLNEDRKYQFLLDGYHYQNSNSLMMMNNLFFYEKDAEDNLYLTINLWNNILASISEDAYTLIVEECFEKLLTERNVVALLNPLSGFVQYRNERKAKSRKLKTLVTTYQTNLLELLHKY